jgi:uncharacterized protein GlcG (DUF336 family)
MTRQLTLLSALSLIATSGFAMAQDAASARAPELALALEAAQAALAACAANNVRASASIVDAAGVHKVLLAADGVRGSSVEVSIKKAYTASVMKISTVDLVERMKTDKALEAKISADKSLWARPGGFPFMAGNEVIGAIGVAGAQALNGVAGGERDAVCAKAGLDKIQARLK